jgi:hypothetical protein
VHDSPHGTHTALAAAGDCFVHLRLCGEIAALATLTVICFSPDMLAHGSLVTSDIFLAVAIVGSLWAWDTFLHEASWKTAIVLGAAVGLAALSKYTGGLLLVILPLTLGILLVLRKSGVCQRDWPFTITRSTLLHGLVAVMTMVLVVNVCYGFKDTMFSLGAYQFRQPALQSLRDVLPAWTPVPLPADYLLGIDAQLGDPQDGYLLGRFGRSFWSLSPRPRSARRRTTSRISTPPVAGPTTATPTCSTRTSTGDQTS